MTFKSIIEHLAQKETFGLKENLALKEHEHNEPARRTTLTDQIEGDLN